VPFASASEICVVNVECGIPPTVTPQFVAPGSPFSLNVTLKVKGENVMFSESGPSFTETLPSGGADMYPGTAPTENGYVPFGAENPTTPPVELFELPLNVTDQFVPGGSASATNVTEKSRPVEGVGLDTARPLPSGVGPRIGPAVRCGDPAGLRAGRPGSVVALSPPPPGTTVPASVLRRKSPTKARAIGTDERSGRERMEAFVHTGTAGFRYINPIETGSHAPGRSGREGGTNLLNVAAGGPTMARWVEYEEEEVFPYPRDRVWELLQAHLDPSTIGRIHPLIRNQATITKNGEDTTLRRTIDARGRALGSQWKITLHPPDFSRYEILASEGPWSEGSCVENHYSDAPGGTLIRSRMKLHISVLPFILPQGLMVRRVLNTIDTEDRAFLAQVP